MPVFPDHAQLSQALRLDSSGPSPLSPPFAAVLLPLVQTERGWELLMEVRSQTVRQPGEVCFPGGRTEPGETPEATALRETVEELGIEPGMVTPIGRLALDVHISGRSVQPVTGFLAPEALSVLCPSGQEVAETFTLPIDWLRGKPPTQVDYLLEPRLDQSIPPILRGHLSHYSWPAHTFYWEYEGHGIWGMTARFIQNLLTLWPD